MVSDRVDERLWAAEKREFVADHRDQIGDARDRIADERDDIAAERERLADAREADQDERERALDRRAEALGVAAREVDVDAARRESADRTRAAAGRADAGLERDGRTRDREVARSDRADAAERRDAASSDSQLARAFAQLAANLYTTEDVDGVLDRIVSAAVSTVEGCDMASLTVRDGTGFRTAASSAAAAIETDRAQYDAGEGPCLDAVDGQAAYAASFPDPRWPSLGARPVESGVESASSHHVEAAVADRSGLVGSLNSYAGQPGAFDIEAQEIGLVLASHASLAIQAVSEREALEQMGDQLTKALASRDVIGQAKGILMERYRLTPDQAFDALRRSSQRLNVKLAEVARTLAETGEFTDEPLPRADP